MTSTCLNNSATTSLHASDKSPEEDLWQFIPFLDQSSRKGLTILSEALDGLKLPAVACPKHVLSD